MRSTALQIDDLNGNEINLKSKSSLIHDLDHQYGRLKFTPITHNSVKVFNIDGNIEKNRNIYYPSRKNYIEGDYIIEDAQKPPMLPAEIRKRKLKALFIAAIIITGIITYSALELLSNTL